jgi:hypothetical protein
MDKTMGMLEDEFSGWLKTRTRKVGEEDAIKVEDCMAIWNLLKRHIDEKLLGDDVHFNAKRLSIEHIWCMIFQQFDVTPKELMTRTVSTLTEYLEWEASKLGKAVRKLGQQLVDEWALGTYSAVMKKLVEQGKEGNIRAADLVFSSIGKKAGDEVKGSQPIVEWVQSYGVFDKDGNPASIQVRVPAPQKELPPDA